VAGFVVVAAVLRALVPWRPSLPDGVAVAVALVLVGVGVPFVWAAMRGLDATRDQLTPPHGVSAREKCLVDGGHGYAVAFTRWIDERVPPDARIVYMGRADPVCMQLNLLPRVMAAKGERADYSVYANLVPDDVRAKLAAGERSVLRFQGDLLLVHEG
jgi:hypothetical protein